MDFSEIDYSEMSVQQRAEYLLEKGVEAKLDIDPDALVPGFAAHVIGVGKLPCGYHESEQAAIDAGIALLRAKASPSDPSGNPRCAVRGATRPGAMCSAVIVGGEFCGHPGACEHQVREGRAG